MADEDVTSGEARAEEPAGEVEQGSSLGRGGEVIEGDGGDSESNCQ
jgi:hypothetical protein